LKIEITYPETIEIGSVLRIPFKLVNVSDQRVKTCISQRRGAKVLDSNGRVSTNLVLVDHESCKTRIDLAPHSMLALTDELQVNDDLRPGPGKIVLGLSVISSRGCDVGYGCYSTWISGGLGHTALVGVP
jgi:hypothetical protein